MKTITITILVALAFGGCLDSDTVFDERIDYDREIGRAWSAFESGDFPTAISRFNKVAEQYWRRSEPLDAVGWAYLELSDYGSAKLAFSEAMAREDFQHGSYLGLAVANFYGGGAPDDSHYSRAKVWLDAFFTVDSTWTFDRGVVYYDETDALIFYAFVEFRHGRYEESASIVSKIDPAFSYPTSEDEIASVMALADKITALARTRRSFAKTAAGVLPSGL
jgi:hypothetical protein